MPNSKIVKSKTLWGAFFAALFVGVYLAACGGGGGGGSPAVGGAAVPAPTPAPVTAGAPIAFSAPPADAGGGQVIVNVPNGTAGALIVNAGDPVVITSNITTLDGPNTATTATPTSITVTATLPATLPTTITGSVSSVGGILPSPGCTTTTTGTAGAITLPKSTVDMDTVPSRFAGVAPLAVFFDATGAAATATTRPFHDIEYRWDFGDKDGAGTLNKSPPLTGATTWANGSRSGVSKRNEATGPVAAHVFETPGIYLVNLTVTDGTNTASNSCIQIAVSDPDVVFAKTNTICVGATSDPTPGAGGCPAGADHFMQASFPTIVSTYLTTGKRVLLKVGDIFTGSTTAKISSTGPWTLGSYPPGGAAKIQNSGGGAGLINVIEIGASAGVFASDGRIMDLEINGLGSATPKNLTSVGGAGNFDQLTLLRLNINNIGDGPIFYAGFIDVPGNTRVWDQLAIVDSTIQKIMGGSARHGIYAFATRFAVLGNLIDDTTAAEHLVRIEYADRAMFSNNQFSNGPIAEKCKETFALRGVGQNTADAYYFPNVLPTPSPTQNIVLSDNKFDVTCFTGLKVGPVDSVTHTTIQNVISERNWYMTSTTPVADSVIITQASSHVIRNELMDMTNFRDYQPIALVGASTGMPAASNIEVYNNSFFSSVNPNQGTIDYVFWDSPTAVSNITIKNNLVYAPALSKAFDRIQRGTGGTNVVISNNSTDTSIAPATNQIKLTDPLYTNTATNNWKPQAGSYAIGAGTTVPVWSDFFLVPRPPHDLGAVLP